MILAFLGKEKISANNLGDKFRESKRQWVKIIGICFCTCAFSISMSSLDAKNIALLRIRRTQATTLPHNRTPYIKYETWALIEFCIIACIQKKIAIVIKYNENYVTFKCVSLFLSPDQISSRPWPGTFVDRRGTSLIGLVDSSQSVSCITTL